MTETKKEIMLKSLEEFSGINRRYILSRNRRQDYVKPRALLAYLLYFHEKLSYTGVARVLKRDHSSIRNLCQNVFIKDDLMESYRLYLNIYKKNYDKFVQESLANRSMVE